MQTTTKNPELKELIRQGTHILNEIKAIDYVIELADDPVTIFELNKAKNNLQQQFNAIFDKVFGGDVQ